METKRFCYFILGWSGKCRHSIITNKYIGKFDFSERKTYALKTPVPFIYPRRFQGSVDKQFAPSGKKHPLSFCIRFEGSFCTRWKASLHKVLYIQNCLPCRTSHLGVYLKIQNLSFIFFLLGSACPGERTPRSAVLSPKSHRKSVQAAQSPSLIALEG